LKLLKAVVRFAERHPSGSTLYRHEAFYETKGLTTPLPDTLNIILQEKLKAV